MNEIAATLQIALVVFYGPPLALFFGAAIVGAIVEMFTLFLTDDVRRVRIVGRDDA